MGAIRARIKSILMLALLVLIVWKICLRSPTLNLQQIHPRTPKEIPYSLEDIRERNAARISKIEQVCRDYGIYENAKEIPVIKHPPSPAYTVFYFHRGGNFAYCPLYKAASTSILHWLLNLANVDDETIQTSKVQISELARRHYPEIDFPEAKRLILKATSLVIVRHPFDRLLSAYRDKLEDSERGRKHGTYFFYEKYGKKIVQKYRRTPSDRIEPTFEEFMRYLSQLNVLHYADDHWIPYYSFCTPCLVNYSVVAKFETLSEDLQLFTNLSGLQGSGQPQTDHVTFGGKSDELRAQYFSKVSRTVLMEVYEKYKPDFELLDYSPDKFLEYTNTP